MSSVVKLPEDLITDAKEVAQLAHRSMAGQISYWASLGKAIDTCIEGSASRTMVRTAKNQSLSKIISMVDSPEGRFAVREHLNARPFPHYEAEEDIPGYVYRIDEDGTRTLGRFSGRTFKPKTE